MGRPGGGPCQSLGYGPCSGPRGGGQGSLPVRALQTWGCRMRLSPVVGTFVSLSWGLIPQGAATHPVEKQQAERVDSGSDQTSGCTRPPTQACTTSRTFRVLPGDGDAGPAWPPGSSSQLLLPPTLTVSRCCRCRTPLSGGPSLTPAPLAGRGMECEVGALVVFFLSVWTWLVCPGRTENRACLCS